MQNQYYGRSPAMQRPPRFLGAQACKWLIIVNIVVYLLDFSGVDKDGHGRMTLWGGYVTDYFLGGQVWRPVTCQFLHSSPLHLLGNMLMVFIFGPIVERFLGTKKFIAYYLLSGIAGPLFYSILFPHEHGLMVGASAGIFGILVALIIIAPDMRVMLLFPPIPMKMRTLGIAALLVAAFSVLTTGDNYGGEAGHLGGALMGFVLMKFPGLLGFVDGGLARRKAKRKRPKVVREAKIKPRTTVNLKGDEVDRILDKISAEGFQSLTVEERETLNNASKKNDE